MEYINLLQYEENLKSKEQTSSVQVYSPKACTTEHGRTIKESNVESTHQQQKDSGSKTTDLSNS